MTAGELRLLRVASCEFVTNTIEELDIALLGVLLEGTDEGPGHGTGSLRGDSGIGTIEMVSCCCFGCCLAENKHKQELGVGRAN